MWKPIPVAGEGSGEAEARLLAFCRRFVADAAADAWGQHAAAAGRAGDGGQALTPEGYSWDQVRHMVDALLYPKRIVESGREVQAADSRDTSL